MNNLTNNNPHQEKDEFLRFATSDPAKRARGLRRQLLKSTSYRDMQEIWRTLLDQAKSGDKTAMKMVLEYTVGKPQPMDLGKPSVAEQPGPQQLTIQMMNLSMDQLERMKQETLQLPSEGNGT